MLVNDQQPFQFMLAKIAHVAVVSFIGKLDMRHEHTSLRLIDCRNQLDEAIGNDRVQTVVLNLRDLNDIQEHGLLDFEEWQDQWRRRGLILRLCGLHPKLKMKLIQTGVVRAEELAHNIVEAVASTY